MLDGALFGDNNNYPPDKPRASSNNRSVSGPAAITAHNYTSTLDRQHHPYPYDDLLYANFAQPTPRSHPVSAGSFGNAAFDLDEFRALQLLTSLGAAVANFENEGSAVAANNTRSYLSPGEGQPPPYSLHEPERTPPTNSNSEPPPQPHSARTHPMQNLSLSSFWSGPIRGQSANTNPRAPLQSRSTSTHTCTICVEDRQRDEFPTTPITAACTHPLTDVCKECIRRYIASELSRRGTAALTCPVCRQNLTHSDVRHHATREDFNRYDERAAVEAMENDPRFRWCPNAGCGAGQIQERGDAEPKATCFRCRQPFCFIHRVRWHSGLTCRQFDKMPELANMMREAEETERTLREASSASSQRALRASAKAAKEKQRREAEERAGEAYVRKETRRCPGCNWHTQRAGGCKHMTCMLNIRSVRPRAHC